MKNILIFLIIVIIAIYMISGRYAEVGRNIEHKGISALMDEPAWLADWIGKKWDRFAQSIHNKIDNAAVGEKY